MKEIKISNDSETTFIEKSNQHENYKISNTDGQIIWCTENELRELKYMIDDILEMWNKKDW